MEHIYFIFRNEIVAYFIIPIHQGGILFWLHGNLRDVQDISSEIALIKI
jgi:hypothetical protein